MKNNYLFLFLNICFLLFIPIFAAEALPLPWEAEDMPQFIYYSFEFAIIIAGLIAFGVLVFAGFRYMTSTGNPTTMADARSQILAAFLGLVILLGSWLILYTIDPHLVKIEPPRLDAPPDTVILLGHYQGEATRRPIVGNVANLGNFIPNRLIITRPPEGHPKMELILWSGPSFEGSRQRRIVFFHGTQGIDRRVDLPGDQIIYEVVSSPVKSVEFGIYRPFEFVFIDEPTTIRFREARTWAFVCWLPGANVGRFRIKADLKAGETQQVFFSIGEDIPEDVPFERAPKYTYDGRQVPASIQESKHCQKRNGYFLEDIPWPDRLTHCPPQSCLPSCDIVFGLKSDWVPVGIYKIRINAWWFDRIGEKWLYNYTRHWVIIKPC